MRILTFCFGAMRTNTYFCFDDAGACAVIDPGMDGESVWQKLCEKGLRPSHILLTHGHFDHAEGAAYLAKESGAAICIHRDDAVMLSNPALGSAAFYYRGDLSGYPRCTADVLLEEGSVLSIGSLNFTVLHTPGHTPGSVSFASENTLFCGDTVFAYGYGRFDLWGGDRMELARSLKRIAALGTDYKLCPGHGNTATLSRRREGILAEISELERGV